MMKKVVHSLVCCASLCVPTALSAAVISVCDEPSLRTAIAGGGTVTFACDGTITLSNTISINADVFLDGVGRNVTIDGGNAVRLFEVSPGVTFSLRQLSLRNGFARGTNGAPNQNGGPGQGAAIYNGGGIVLSTDCRFLQNMAFGGPGGLGLDAAPNQLTAGSGGAGEGGAVFNSNGQFHATNCIFAGNQALGGVANSNVVSQQIVGNGGAGRGGAMGTRGGTVVLKGCSFSNNIATATTNGTPLGQPGGPGYGGALYVDGGIVHANDVLFAVNVSEGAEGTTGPFGGIIRPGAGGSSYGGTAYTTNAQFLATNCTFTLSTARGGKAAVGTISYIFVQGGNADGGALYCSGGTVHLVGSKITKSTAVPGLSMRYSIATYGSGSAAAGGIFNDGAALNIVGSEMVGNSATSLIGYPSVGGAIYHRSGTITIKQSLFATNSVEGGRGHAAGSLPMNAPGAPGQGGALFVANGVAEVDACAFVHNIAAGGRQPGLGDAGDGHGGAVYNAARISMTNCTISANQAVGGSGYPDGGSGYGAGIYNAGGTSVCSYVTIATNTASPGVGNGAVASGGGVYSAAGMMQLYASILSQNAPSNCFGAAITDAGFNLSSDSSCPFSASGSQINVDPHLGPVDDYGGGSLTMPLLAGSPAFNAATGAVCPSTDQRGRARPFGGACDIGAFESSPPYTIRGRITGHFIGPGIAVSGGGQATVTDATLMYRLDGLAAGSHSVVPSTANHLVIPSSRDIPVGPDILGIDFTAYRWNTLNADAVGGGTVRLRYPGTNAEVIRLQASSDLVNWTNRATNTVGPDGLTDFLQPTGANRQFFRTLKP